MHSSQNGQHEAHHKPGFQSQNGQCEMQPALVLGFHDQLLTLSSCRSVWIHIFHLHLHDSQKSPSGFTVLRPPVKQKNRGSIAALWEFEASGITCKSKMVSRLPCGLQSRGISNLKRRILRRISVLSNHAACESLQAACFASLHAFIL